MAAKADERAGGAKRIQGSRSIAGEETASPRDVVVDKPSGFM
jgi:hypothetical protein